MRVVQQKQQGFGQIPYYTNIFFIWWFILQSKMTILMLSQIDCSDMWT